MSNVQATQIARLDLDRSAGDEQPFDCDLAPAFAAFPSHAQRRGKAEHWAAEVRGSKRERSPGRHNDRDVISVSAAVDDLDGGWRSSVGSPLIEGGDECRE